MALSDMSDWRKGTLLVPCCRHACTRGSQASTGQVYGAMMSPSCHRQMKPMLPQLPDGVAEKGPRGKRGVCVSRYVTYTKHDAGSKLGEISPMVHQQLPCMPTNLAHPARLSAPGVTPPRSAQQRPPVGQRVLCPPQSRLQLLQAALKILQLPGARVTLGLGHPQLLLHSLQERKHGTSTVRAATPARSTAVAVHPACTPGGTAHPHLHEVPQNCTTPSCWCGPCRNPKGRSW